MRSTSADASLRKRNAPTVVEMSEDLFYTIFATSAGWMGLLGSTHGLRRATLPQASEQAVRRLMGGDIDEAVWSPPFFQDLMERLKDYFSGHEATFLDKLDLSRATLFQCEVWETTRLIPYGETRSYAWVAGQIKKPKASRATGQALGKNPLPIFVPCHRVLASNGTLGGFTGGIDTKKHLLNSYHVKN